MERVYVVDGPSRTQSYDDTLSGFAGIARDRVAVGRYSWSDTVLQQRVGLWWLFSIRTARCAVVVYHGCDWNLVRTYFSGVAS